MMHYLFVESDFMFLRAEPNKEAALLHAQAYAEDGDWPDVQIEYVEPLPSEHGPDAVMSSHAFKDETAVSQLQAGVLRGELVSPVLIYLKLEADPPIQIEAFESYPQLNARIQDIWDYKDVRERYIDLRPNKLLVIPLINFKPEQLA